jgi:hypothetical protein
VGFRSAQRKRAPASSSPSASSCTCSTLSGTSLPSATYTTEPGGCASSQRRVASSSDDPEASVGRQRGRKSARARTSWVDATSPLAASLALGSYNADHLMIGSAGSAGSARVVD